MSPNSLSPSFHQRYKRSLIEPDWAIDLRHVLVIHDLLISGMFRHALEIGAHYGVSTCAFVAAAERRHDLRISVCDTRITSVVRDLVGRSAAAPRIELLECESVRALEQILKRGAAIDIALLDGSHVYHHNASEAALLQCLGARTLLLHDAHSMSFDQYGRDYLFDGPKKLIEKFQHCSSWLVVEDKRMRVGERTDRGLALVTRDREIWGQAVEVFSAWASLSLADVQRTAGAVS